MLRLSPTALKPMAKPLPKSFLMITSLFHASVPGDESNEINAIRAG